MSNNTSQKTQKNSGSLLIAAFFILAGIITLYDTSHYSDIDSKIFPQTIAIILIICSSVSFLMQWRKPIETEGVSTGSWWRRILLIASMLIACAVMPFLGFLPASGIAFFGAMIAAMHEQWSVSKIVLYVGSSLFVMGAFYWLFRYVLAVPLPQ